MRRYLLISGVLFFFVFWGCEDKQSTKPTESTSIDLLIYGRPTCSRCAAFKNNCDAENLDYQFYNIDENQEKNQEMWEKLQTAGFGNSVGLPVVDVVIDGESHIYSNPAFETILGLIKGN